MWKKIGYVLLALFIAYFIYVIFYKKIAVPDETALEQLAKTKKVVYYLKDDAIIYAEEQIGTPNDKEIKFKKVIVDLLKKDVMLSGDEGIVNTETQDITITGNIIGKTKDNKWNVFTEQVSYEKATDRIFSNTRTKAVNNEDKTIIFGDKFETTTKFEQLTLTGNVDFQKEEQRITGNQVIYFDLLKKVDARGNVYYKDNKSELWANQAVYEMEKEVLTADGSVRYKDKETEITAGHAVYDMIAEVVVATGGGIFKYPSNNVDGQYIDGVYNLKEQILDTNSAFTLNNDGYIIKGSNLHYIVPSGDATMNSYFTVRKENFVVGGSSGTANTNTKDIFANSMVMTSDQGDRITSRTGQGSFEKREFRFDGNVDGKIRGNVKDFVKSKEKLVDENAIFFKGNTAKMYFLVQQDNEYSMTRGEIKENVDVRYKDMNLFSEYNEIDAGKNIVLARDNVIMTFREKTQMTANYFYLDLNTEKGYAQSNVKILNNIGARNVSISADKASLDNKTRKIDLTGNVVAYKDKTRISSNKASYDIDKRILQNEQNIKVDFYLNTSDSSSTNDKKNEQKEQDAVDNVYNNLNVSIPESGRVNLPKNVTAANQTPVTVNWVSSDNGVLDKTGKMNKPYYGAGRADVALTAELNSGGVKRSKVFNLTVPSESAEDMLERASKKLYIPNMVQIGQEVEFPKTVKVNIYKNLIEIPVEWSNSKETVSDRTKIYSNTDYTATLYFNGKTFKKTYNVKVKETM